MNKYRIHSYVVIVLITVLLGCETQSQQEVEEIIAQSKRATRMDVLCRDTPKPPGMKLVRKSLTGNSDWEGVTHYYRGPKDGKEDIRPFFNRWARENNWQKTDTSTYESKRREIVVERARRGWQIYCYEKSYKTW